MFSRVFTAATYLFFAAFGVLALLLAGMFLPASIGYQVRIVESGSMGPTIPLGAAIVVRPADSYAVGDVVTFQRREDDEVTTHRIVADRISEGVLQYTMRGDANNVDDSRTVAPEEIVGKVRFHVPYLGFILDFIRQPIGFLILVGIPAAFIVFEQWQTIAAEVRKQKPSEPDETKS